MTRPLQPHGTPARARGRRRTGIPPCTCTPCKEALRSAARKRRILLELGHPGRVPAAAAAHHLSLLFEAGMSWPQIMEATGVSHGVIVRLRRPDGASTNIHATTSARILAAPIPPRDKRVPGEAHVDGTGTRRRLQALERAGWTTPALAEHIGFSQRQLNRLLRWPRVNIGTRAAVMDLYRRLEEVPGPSSSSAKRAAAKGWAPPSAWVGLDMDDPAVTPLTVAREPARPLVVAENAEYIRRTTGVGDDLVAERLGITVLALKKNLERAQVLRAAELEVAA